jgi:UDP-glucose 4-epimerase
MKILLTGASSFTGLWLATMLAQAGHEVTTPLRRAGGDYGDGVRGSRVKLLRKIGHLIESCPFGTEPFHDLIRGERFNVLCHHASLVDNYRSIDFDIAKAIGDNTRNLPAILRLGLERGLHAVILTGSVFEQNEGAGSQPLLAFSPYGLSKGATSDIFRYWCAKLDLKLAKFVIPNPFGPFEERRFCAYLLQRWRAGKSAVVRTPSYVRDNIHASLLAKSYVRVVEEIDRLPAFSRSAPSEYVETQSAFARRFAREIGGRLGLDCNIETPEQTEFSEPMVRINTDPCNPTELRWSEEKAWNELADYYRNVGEGL